MSGKVAAKKAAPKGAAKPSSKVALPSPRTDLEQQEESIGFDGAPENSEDFERDEDPEEEEEVDGQGYARVSSNLLGRAGRQLGVGSNGRAVKMPIWQIIGIVILTIGCTILAVNMGFLAVGHAAAPSTAAVIAQKSDAHALQLNTDSTAVVVPANCPVCPPAPECKPATGTAAPALVQPAEIITVTGDNLKCPPQHPRADPDFDWAFYVRPQTNVRFPSDSYPYLRKDGFPCHYTSKGKDPGSRDGLFSCVSRHRESYKTDPDQAKKLDCHKRRKVYDTFKFNNELAMLETRLANNWDVTDFFVIIESNMAYAGQQKEYAFASSYLNFTKYMSKIIHIRCELSTIQIENDNESNEMRGWLREEGSSDCLKFGLGMADPDDIVIVGDTDEIPKPEVVSALQMCSQELGVLTPDHDHDLGYGQDQDTVIRLAGHKWVSSWKWQQILSGWWVANSIGIRKQTYNKGTCWYRNNPPNIGLIEDGNWHCSSCFFGDLEAQVKKLNRFSELGVAKRYLADMEDLQKFNTDPSTSKEWAGHVRVWTDYDYLPKWVRDHPERWKDKGFTV